MTIAEMLKTKTIRCAECKRRVWLDTTGRCDICRATLCADCAADKCKRCARELPPNTWNDFLDALERAGEIHS